MKFQRESRLLEGSLQFSMLNEEAKVNIEGVDTGDVLNSKYLLFYGREGKGVCPQTI